MVDRLSMLIAGGITGTSIVTLCGLLIRSFPALYLWAYAISIVAAVAAVLCFSLNNRELSIVVGMILFFVIFGLLLALLGG